MARQAVRARQPAQCATFAEVVVSETAATITISSHRAAEHDGILRYSLM